MTDIRFGTDGWRGLIAGDLTFASVRLVARAIGRRVRAEGGAGAGPDRFERLGAEMPEGPSGLLVLPFFEPTGAPLFMSDHSGCVLGLTTATTRGQILKGIVEGTAYYFADSLSAMESVGCRTDRFVASGGGARSDRWLQTYADVFGRPFVRAAAARCARCQSRW